jgi:glycosyltransferase involved in cell wall biosynthesis
VKRLKIYALLAKSARLPMTGGDIINEMRFLRALSEFADVYYNNHLFLPDEPGFGLPEGAITPPRQDCDLYYVRANLQIYRACPRPRASLGLPYDEEVFSTADAIFTTTSTWKDMLERYSPDWPPKSWVADWYGDRIVKPKRILDIGQVSDPSFVPRDGHPLAFRYRAMFGYGRTVGYFGRIDKETVPGSYLEVLPELTRRIPKLTTVFAGNIRIPLPREVKVVKRISYEEMPFAISACDLLLYDCADTGNWAGSGKVIDAISCGVPVLMARRQARYEQMGEDYPLFFDSKQDLMQKMERFFSDEPFREHLRGRVLELAKPFRTPVVARRLEPEIRAIIEASRADDRRSDA